MQTISMKEHVTSHHSCPNAH